MKYQEITFDIKNGIAYVEFNRPDTKNALTKLMVEELRDCFEQCNYDKSIRAVLIRGAGGCFCTGGDLKEMQSALMGGKVDSRSLQLVAGEAILRLRNIRKPTIALVEGAAIGSGLCFMLACDLAYAAEDAKMSFAFAPMGFVPDLGAVNFLLASAGTVRTTELLMTGKRFTGIQAKEWGIVTDAFPKEQLEDKVLKIAEQMAVGPTVAYSNLKALINRVAFQNLASSLENEIEYQYICNQTDDNLEAIVSYIEKRKPVFQGR